MIRVTVATVLCAVASLSGRAAGGKILVGIEDKTIVPATGGGRVTLAVTFEETPGFNAREDLIGYDLDFVLERVGGDTGGLRFVPPYAEKPQPFVFPGPADFYAFGPDQVRSGVLVNVFSRSGGVEIARDPLNAARLVLEYDPATPPGEYRVRLDSQNSMLGSGEGGPELGPEIDFSDVGVIRLVPEPASLSVFVPCALLALRRRRRPGRAAVRPPLRRDAGAVRLPRRRGVFYDLRVRSLGHYVSPPRLAFPFASC